MSVLTLPIDARPVAMPAGSPLPRASNGQQPDATGRER
jgi:hypothetical protein